MDQIKHDYRTAAISPADRVMLDFVVKLTVHPDRMAEEDVERLRKGGFEERQILEITHIAGYFNYINRVADALGVDPEPNWTAREQTFDL